MRNENEILISIKQWECH